MNEPVLRVENLSKRFPGLQALDNVSLEIGAHEVVGLIGENGAGKSTLLKVLAGLYPPDSGRIVLRGKEVTIRGVVGAADAGIGMVFQEQSLLPNITVAENILLGRESEAMRFGLYNWRKLNALAAAQLAKLGSRIAPDAETDSLTFTERQVVELAKVLSIEERTRHEPIVLLDEPTSVLEAEEVQTVLNLIRRRRERASVVFVSHRLDEVLSVSDRVYVMTNGRCVAERDPRNCDVAELQRLMLGRDLADQYTRKPTKSEIDPARIRLKVDRLGKRGAFEDVSFDLHAGEVLGIAGVQGSGREGLCRTLFGAEPFDEGSYAIDGVDARFNEPADAVRAGIGYLPAERRVEGIVGGLSVKDNMTLAHLEEVKRGPIIDARHENALTRKWIDQLQIKTRSPATPAQNLSGGNQQKVALTKWLIATDPRVLILDHPMRGLDVGAKSEIFTLVRGLTKTGIGILLIADTIEELIALSDTVIVMRDGRITGRFSAGEKPPTQLEILERMV